MAYTNTNVYNSSVVAPTAYGWSYSIEVPVRELEHMMNCIISDEDSKKLMKSIRIHEKSLALLGQ